MNTQCNLFKKTVPGWWRSAQLPSHLFEGWRTIVTGDVIYSPGRSLGFIRSSSIDIVSTSNTQQKNFYSINVYEILSSGKVAPNINFATCAGAWSIRGYFRQLGSSVAQPIIASRIGEPWNACLYNFSSWPDCSLLCLQWQCPGLALRLPWVRSVSTVLSFSMLPLCVNSVNM